MNSKRRQELRDHPWFIQPVHALDNIVWHLSATIQHHLLVALLPHGLEEQDGQCLLSQNVIPNLAALSVLQAVEEVRLQLQGVVVKHPLCCWPLLYLPLQLLPWRRTDLSCLHPQLPAELLYQSRPRFQLLTYQLTLQLQLQKLLHGIEHVPPPFGHYDTAGEVIVEQNDVLSILGDLRAFNAHREVHVRILVYWGTLEELICGRIRGQGHRDDRVQDEVRSL